MVIIANNDLSLLDIENQGQTFLRQDAASDLLDGNPLTGGQAPLLPALEGGPAAAGVAPIGTEALQAGDLDAAILDQAPAAQLVLVVVESIFDGRDVVGVWNRGGESALGVTLIVGALPGELGASDVPAGGILMTTTPAETLLDPSVELTITRGGDLRVVTLDLVDAILPLAVSLDPPCAPDIDGDGELTLFDFLAFQNLFDAGDPAADFDGDGRLTLFDFLAFQNAFDAGCG